MPTAAMLAAAFPPWWKDPLTVWTLLVFFAGMATGWVASRIPGWLDNRRARAEVELFTTTTPNAYPVGEVIGQPAQVVDGRYRVTRHEPLGMVQALGAEPRWPVRIWGVPTDGPKVSVHGAESGEDVPTP